MVMRNHFKKRSTSYLLLLIGCLTAALPAQGEVTLPGTIEAEDYDGAQDSTWYNEGGEYGWGKVDIGIAEDTDGGYYVGWTKQGEYIHYNILVPTAGDYQFKTRISTPKDGRRLHFKLNGSQLGETATLPNTGGWQNWQTIESQHHLSAGSHILEIFFESREINVNYIQIEGMSSVGEPISLPGRVEAEDFVNYYDTTSGNSGGEYRNTDVDIERTSDDGAGFNVGWTDSGESLSYEIFVEKSGRYQVAPRVSTIKDGRSLSLRLNGSYLGDPFLIPNTGGWQNWQTISQSVELPEGNHQLEVMFANQEINLNYIDIHEEDTDDPNDPDEPKGWNLVWSDEFNGTAIDAQRWNHSDNGWGGGNNELQYYTPRQENAYVDNGSLKITARREYYEGSDGGRDFTSARLDTKGKMDFLYGRVDVRAKLPSGQGLWPAIWMLPTDDAYGGWASSGEIDIMEAVNLQVDGNNSIHGTLHYGGKWPDNTHSGDKVTPATNVATQFHTYSVEWEPEAIRWYIDGKLYQTQTQWWSEGGSYPAPFDQRFHLILNVAVGGNWPGSPNQNTVFPQIMEVDYVRVYEKGQQQPGDECDSLPYGGRAVGIPGRIEAENYNSGCAEFAYSDVEPENLGGEYRDGGVDIERANDVGAGYSLGWLRDGEWLEYTVMVESAGKYDLDLRVASEGNGSVIRFESAGYDISGDIKIPHTGGWQTWRTTTLRGITLEAGQQTLRMHVVDGDFNLNYIDVKPAGKGPHSVDKSRGEWTLVVIPDTQHYSQNRDNAPIAHMRTAFQWLVDTKEDLNIKFVQGLGDITEGWNQRWEWDNSTSAWDKLYGQVPFMPIIGNHDDPWMMNQYFPVSSFSNEAWWGGDFGGVENNYGLMTIGSEDYLFLQVETYDQYSDYRPAGMEWAKQILARYPNRKVILATHDTWATSHIKNNLLTKYDNIVMSNAGHVCQREAYYTQNGPRGGVSHNFIVDYQCDAQEVMLLRYYVFKPMEDRVDYFTYSPVTGQFEADDSSQGSFALIQKDP
ncbi:hypothetical protein DU002_06200 [Corallincola holothuriorum]|uniref:Uncharacterized protein n=2 Tax=Corallincola holothuriorum TaxID=2282215 RepID=A0A368NMN2_9GAMM|nr:hypothetical protein DU002_06200 [Corallincola holothuriorum]